MFCLFEFILWIGVYSFIFFVASLFLQHLMYVLYEGVGNPG